MTTLSAIAIRPPVALIVFGLLFSLDSVARAQVVPGTGQALSNVGDDFEGDDWQFDMHWPKSSKNIDRAVRGPTGKAKNGRWYEGVKRGEPDYIRRVETPLGGLPRSSGALLLRSLYTGVPYRPSYKMQQDDFIANVMYRTGGAISAARSPSVVSRVFVPPLEEWERRSGPTFAFRLALNPANPWAVRKKDPSDPDTYWPGFMIDFRPKEKHNAQQDTAYLRIRANSRGGDYRGPQITQAGWWTLGMSVTPDGRVHYYARQGVEDLTRDDHIASEYPYGLRCRSFRTFFFNVLNSDDGKTWSTEWIVDDPTVYTLR